MHHGVIVSVIVDSTGSPHSVTPYARIVEVPGPFCET
jgi:hypothetical protein